MATTRDQIAAAWRDETGRPGPDQPLDALQNPQPFFFPGLSARPFWDAAAFPWIRELEANAAVVRAELDSLLAEGYLQTPPIASIPPADRYGDQKLVDGDVGGWDLFRFAYNGAVIEANRALCPRTAELVERVPRHTGSIGFGVLHPGTHIVPHCGISNSKLRIHLGLITPPGCELRVGRETRAWTEGKCLMFDDSFEHEVWSRASTTRYIFMLDIHHPELTDTEIEWIAKMFEMFLARGSREADGTRWSNRWQLSAQTNP